ncbi:hypothetical protein GCM10023107_01910 [Actinoplanes octamycinicus]
MEVDLVEAVTVAVDREQAGLVPVRLVGPALGLLAARAQAELVQVGVGPAGALTPHRLGERGVGGDVVAGQGRRLVEHLVRHARTLLHGNREQEGPGVPTVVW